MHANGHAFATGLMNCGSVWACPTCSNRIQTRRLAETETALIEHAHGGGNIAMLTLTMRHSPTQPLTELLDTLNTAWAKLQRRAAFRPIYRATIGTITELEITTGAHGWHPHLHILLLIAPDHAQDYLSPLAEHLRPAWSRLVNTKTDKHSLTHGLELTWFGHDSASAAKYIHKIAKEITLNQNKSEGTTHDPFTLLDTNSPTNTARFIEYVEATHGRQATRWSNGLKRALIPFADDLTDEELADDNTTEGATIMIVTKEQWNALPNDQQLDLIEWSQTQFHSLSP